MARKIRHQPRIKGVKRLPVSAGVLPQLKAWLDREARMYGVSRAFVQANCVSFVSTAAALTSLVPAAARPARHKKRAGLLSPALPSPRPEQTTSPPPP